MNARTELRAASLRALVQLVCVLGALLSAAPRPASAGEVQVPFGITNRNVAVRSMKELRFLGAIQQQYDFSCGAAAVATLLTHHYGDPTSETDVFKEMWVSGDQKKIRQVGFSLFNMKNYLRNRGYAADGFRVSLDQLERAALPAIALIDVKGYKHFVVIKGISGNEILIGDPALGVRVADRAEFEPMRDEVLLVIRNHLNVARTFFNTDQDWRPRPRPPVQIGIGRGDVGSFTMLLPASNEF